MRLMIVCFVGDFQCPLVTGKLAKFHFATFTKFGSGFIYSPLPHTHKLSVESDRTKRRAATRGLKPHQANNLLHLLHLLPLPFLSLLLIGKCNLLALQQRLISLSISTAAAAAVHGKCTEAASTDTNQMPKMKLIHTNNRIQKIHLGLRGREKNSNYPGK